MSTFGGGERTPLCDLLSGCGDAELLLALSQFEQIDGVKKGAAETERKGLRSEEGAGGVAASVLSRVVTIPEIGKCNSFCRFVK